MIQCSLYIDGIPENDSICHQPQRTQLILLPILIAFPDFTFLPVANRSGYSMSAFSPVELSKDKQALAVQLYNEKKTYSCADLCVDGDIEANAVQIHRVSQVVQEMNLAYVFVRLGFKPLIPSRTIMNLLTWIHW